MPQPLTLPIFSDQQASKRPWFGIFGVSILILLALAGFAAWLMIRIASVPNQVAQEFYQDLQEGRTDEAWSLTSREFKTATPRENLDALGNTLRSNGLTELTTQKREIIKGTAIGTKTVVTGTAQGKDKRYLITADLVRENSHWRIFGFKVSEIK